jgi:3-deoxy-D-arabino-heptulosonate 7-phosphate (DAHP) synthase
MEKKPEKMENKKEMRNWLNEFNLTHPFVIAGPCSAETEEQVLKIAQEYGNQERVQEDLKV